MSGLSDYERTKTLRRAFVLLAWLHQCPRTLAFLAEQLGVCARTVRRDLYTLEQAGIPLMTEKVPELVERRGIHGDRIQMTTAWRVIPGARCPICRRRVLPSVHSEPARSTHTADAGSPSPRHRD